MTCTVVCPIYKSTLNKQEALALQNNIEKLKGHRFVLLIADNINLYFYEKFRQNKVCFKVIDQKHFASIKSYNSFLMSVRFWELFSTEFILICQYDAWVFSDQIGFWINKPYDYIGAPWFKGFLNARPDSNLIKVGNGGFSLRNRSSMIRVLTEFSVSKSIIDALKTLNWLKLYYLIKNALSVKGCNEDKFFCYCVDHIENYQIAPISEALKFAFEINPEKLYDLNNSKLPFGCHGWDKYSTEFWKKYIPELFD